MLVWNHQSKSPNTDLFSTSVPQADLADAIWAENATLRSRRLLSSASSDRHIWLYQVETTDPALTDLLPGDSVDLQMRSDPELAAALVPLLRPDRQPDPQTLTAALQMRELREPSKALVDAVARKTGDTELLEMMDDPVKYLNWVQPRDVVEVVSKARGALTGTELLALLPQARARAYSLAAAPCTGQPLELLVRTVCYHRDGRTQWGTASGGLERHTPDGARLRLRPRPNSGFHLPDETDADILLIASGVGIAPFRAFLQQRAHRKDTGRTWVIFGLRNVAEDLLVGEELKHWLNTGTLWRLDLAQSRPHEGSGRYAQDVLDAEWDRVDTFLRGGGRLFLCGSAHGLARGVRDVLARRGGADLATELAASGQYREDVY